MQRRLAKAVLVLGLLTACSDELSDGTTSDGGATIASETGALAGITAAHNRARAAVTPSPSTPLPPLTWSDTVAATAQAWASQCQFGHNPSSPFGENIFATTVQSTTSSQVVDDWVGERQSYDYATNRCSRVCGHYTQVVWAKSLRLGCAVQTCTKNSPFGSGPWQFWVCSYDPPGNFNGERPY